MGTTSANDIAEGIRAMNPTNPLETLLASGRAFTMTLPDGTRFEVSAADVNADVNAACEHVNNDVNASENVNTNVNTDVNSHPENVNGHVNTEAQMAPTPEPAPAEADVNNAHVNDVNVKSAVNVNETDELPKSLQAVLDLFGEGEELSNADIAERLHIKPTAACNRVRRLVVLERLHAGVEKGKYFVNLPPENAVGVHMTVPCEDVNSPNAATATLASNREEKREPSNYSKSTTYGKSLGSNANVIGSYRANQSVPADQSQEPSSDRSPFSHGHIRSDDPTPSPAPAAISHKPPATDSIDLDDLDEDERDALEAEECAASGRAPIRLNPPKHTRQNPWVMPPPVPKREPHAHADVPVVVEDDDEDEGWDPDEHVSGCL